MDERISKALGIAWQYGQIDGGRHKMWVIDQMVRVLCGSSEEYYDWVNAYSTPVGNEEPYVWNTGIMP